MSRAREDPMPGQLMIDSRREGDAVVLARAASSI